jgi:hypothetical protein
MMFFWHDSGMGDNTISGFDDVDLVRFIPTLDGEMMMVHLKPDGVTVDMKDVYAQSDLSLFSEHQDTLFERAESMEIQD